MARKRRRVIHEFHPYAGSSGIRWTICGWPVGDGWYEAKATTSSALVTCKACPRYKIARAREAALRDAS